MSGKVGKGYDWASFSHNLVKEISHSDAPWDGKPALTGLQMQTSSNALPVPIVYGQTKVAPNIIWYNDFKANRAKAGKGGAKGTGTYTYQASIILGVCEGPINDINNVWKDLYAKTAGGTFVSVNGATEFEGTYPQTPWSYVTTAHPTEALPYPGIAYIGIPNYNLGDQAQVPQHTFEVNGLLYMTGVGGTVPDADPALMVQDFLTNANYGTSFRAACLDTDSLLSGPDAPTTGDAAYQTYCQAMGFSLSAALSGAEDAGTIITRWLGATNSDVVWSADKLRFVPYGDTTVTANGVTYVPDLTVRWNFTDDDYIYQEGDDPVTFERADPSDAKNQIFVEIMNRADDYNLKPVIAKDQASIEEFGLLPGDTMTAHEVMTLEMGSTLANLLIQRSAYVRAKYTYTVSSRFIRIEAMDIVTITESRLGMVQYPVRVVEVTEADDGTLTFIAEDFPSDIGTTGVYAQQAATPTMFNAASDPGDINAPVAFEPPAELVNGNPQLWVVASGQNQYWGGCEVWLSTDNTNYLRIGVINPPTIQGVLGATLPAYAVANPDTVNTLSVDLTESNQEVDSVSSADAAAFATLSYVDGELLAYQDATLTGPNAYDLTTLYRGLYGTTGATHATGTKFARLDNSVFKYDLPEAYIGMTLYLKFPSMNTWGNALQDLSGLTPVTVTPTGVAWTLAAPTGVTGSASTVVLPDGSTTIQGQVSWTPSPGQLIDRYEIQYAVSPFSVWTPAITAPGDATSTVINNLSANTTYEVRVRAVRTSGQQAFSNYATSSSFSSGTTSASAPNTPASLSATGSVGGNYLVWTAPSGGTAVQSYSVYAIHAATGSFGSATKIATVNNSTLQFFHGGLGNSDTWRYWVVATNVAGDSSPQGPQNATTSAGGGGGSSVSPFWATAPTAPTLAGTGLTLVQGVAATATATDTTRGIYLDVTGSTATEHNAILDQAIPGATYTMTAFFVPQVLPAEFRTLGLYLKDNSTGKIAAYTVFSGLAANSGGVFRRLNYTTITSFSADSNINQHFPEWTPFWMRLVVGSTNVTCSISIDGENWFDVITESKTQFTATPDHCGVWLGINQSQNPPGNNHEGVHVMSYTCA